jgi:energy-coupling factor transporter ATP-binding protein EcfA2
MKCRGYPVKGVRAPYQARGPDYVFFAATTVPFIICRAVNIPTLYSRLFWRLPEEVNMIGIKNMSVVYPDGTKAVNDVSFTVADGESVALVGANGAVKTSLLLALVGVLPISAGQVAVDGMELNKTTLNEIRRRVGMVFQNPDDQLFMPMIYDDIAFGPRNYGLGEDEVRKRVDAALELFGIGHLRGRSSLKLSGGKSGWPPSPR